MSERVLVVDDDPTIARTLRINLKARGLDVETVGCGLDALSTCADAMPDLVVLDLADDHNVLHQVSEAFSLGMSNADIVSVLTASLDHKLEKLRHEAASAPDDAARLALYIGDDDLLESLPSGLWSALRAQGLVNERTSVAELFLVVYGADALKQLVSRV